MMDVRTCVALPFCVLMLAPAIGASQAEKKQPGAKIDESKLEKRTRPVVCTGGKTMTFDGVLLRVQDTAIQAVGCTITIKNSHIAGAAAIQATGSSDITIENSLIEGSVALQVAGGAAASIKSSTIRGKVEKAGGGKVSDLGDNLWK